MDKLLDFELEDSVAKLLISKLVEYQNKAAKTAQNIIKTSLEEAKKDYSAKLIGTINEKDRKVEQLTTEVSNYKKEMATKVSNFLANTKDEIRDIVAEEIQLDPKFGESQRIVEEMRKIINPVDTEVSTKQLNEVTETSNKRIKELNEAVEFLKKRLDSKESANEILKAKNRANELLESVTSNREIFKAGFSECKSVLCVESTYASLKERLAKVAKKKAVEEKTQKIEKRVEEVAKAKPRSREIMIESKTPEPRPTVKPKEDNSPMVSRMQVLAGMK
jgi:hypothetical protein